MTQSAVSDGMAVAGRKPRSRFATVEIIRAISSQTTVSRTCPRAYTLDIDDLALGLTDVRSCFMLMAWSLVLILSTICQR